MTQFILTESGKQSVDQAVRGHRTQRRNQYSRGVGHRRDPAPEVYVALAPVGGIQGRSGTTPGSASCAIYRITSGTLAAIGNLSKTVYNMSEMAIAAGAYVVVSRTKGGAWVTANNDGSGSTVARAQLNGELLKEDTNATVDNFEALTDMWSGSSPTSARNLLELDGEDNDWCHLVYRPSNGLWDLLAVQRRREVFLVRANANMDAGGSASFDLYNWNGTAWVDSTTDVTCNDEADNACFLTDEFGWAVRSDTDRYDLLEHGLVRTVVAQEVITQGSSGDVKLVDHSGSCGGSTSSLTVTCCNFGSASFPERPILNSERFEAAYMEGRWSVRNIHHPFLMGEVDSNIADTATGTFSIYDALLSDTGVNITVQNHSGATININKLCRAWYAWDWPNPLVEQYQA